MLMETWVWVLLSILLRSCGSIFAKQAALTSIGLGLSGIVINVWYFAEITAFFFQAICWTLALRQFQLNFIYPFMSLVFILNLSAARFIFNEVVDMNHILGIALIIIGVFIITKFAHR